MPRTRKAKRDIDWDMVNGFDAEKWNMMLNEIHLGEMPLMINHSFRIGKENSCQIG